MQGLKRSRTDNCPSCNSEINIFQFSVDSSIEMCLNEECVYPFNEPKVEGLIVEIPYNDTRYSNKRLKTQSSASAANTIKKASDVKQSVTKSVHEESSLVASESSSFDKQKDPIISKSTAGESSVEILPQNITQAPPPKSTVINLPRNIALPPVSAAKSSSCMSLEALESLLSEEDVVFAESECTSPSSSSTINTPKDSSEISWMKDFDGLFAVDITQSKFDPFQGDLEIDSLLGI